MKDFLKNDINIGDTIVCCVPHGRNSGASLSKAIVIGFTNSFVKADIPDYTGYKGTFSQKKISPDKCIVIEKAKIDPVA